MASQTAVTTNEYEIEFSGIKYTVNLDNMTVTLKTGYLEEGDPQWTYLEFITFNFVFKHLSSKGAYKSVLSSEEWAQAYLMCNGFGSITRQEAEEQCWDWSHVRDSSSECFTRVANWIADTKWNPGSINVIMEKKIGFAQKLSNGNAAEYARLLVGFAKA